MIIRPPGQLQWFMRRTRNTKKLKSHKDANTSEIIASVVVAFVILIILDFIFTILPKLIH